MLRIREVRKSKKITAKELANHIKVVESTMSLYENGKREPDFETLLKIANYLDVSVDYLLGNTAEPSTPKRGIKIPVYGNVAAGVPLEAITDIEDWEEISEETAATGEYIALRINGDSMEPKMSKGDVVIVRLQSDVDNGDIAIILINGGDATCKKVQKTPDGILLMSLNTSYAPMFYSNRQIEELPVKVLGKVVELRAKF